MATISVVGLAAFLYPFFTAEAPSLETQAHARDAPLIFGLLAALAASLFVLELSSQGMNAKTASVLAVLTTCAAALRLIPLPAGASAYFFLLIVAGYTFGPRFGMLLGAISLFVSAFASGGLGPWVPYQMFASAWLGMGAGWLGALRPALRGKPTAEIATLAAFGALAGFVYGALMNLWFWPYIASGEEVSWAAGMGIVETLRHYWAFYVLTSFGWDAWAALGNAVLIVAAGRPVLRVLSRFHDRFMVTWS
jgi:energy-coupling factor transport system substrate-specific component